MPEHLLRLRNTDWHLQELYDFLPRIGITVIQAEFSRYVIDANRGPHQNAAGFQYTTCRIPLKDTWGDRILKKPDVDIQAKFRISTFYDPFHTALDQLIEEKIMKFGRAFLIDLHSFAVLAGADISLGAGDYTERGPFLHALLHNKFLNTGFNLHHAAGMPGGYISGKYEGKNSKVDTVMIELNYKTYMPDTSIDGNHRPRIDQSRAICTKRKLETALTQTVNAVMNMDQKYKKAFGLTL